MTGVLVAWAVEVGLITYRDFKKGSKNNVGGLPLPADYLATFIIFGVLALPSGEFQKPATLAAWGYVAATFLNLFDPTFNKAGRTVTTTTSTPLAPAGTAFTNSPSVPANTATTPGSIAPAIAVSGGQ